MDLSIVLEDKAPDPQENPADRPLFFVPNEAMNIRPTGTTLANLYRKCREVHGKYRHPTPLEFAEVADHCLIMCRVLKDEKSSDMINKVKTIVQWQNIGLDCKKMSILRDAAEEMERNTSLHPAVIQIKEEAILKFVTDAYGLHQFQFMITMLGQVKELFDTTYPTLILRDGLGAIPQGSNNNAPASVNAPDQDRVIVNPSSEIIEISDDEE